MLSINNTAPSFKGLIVEPLKTKTDSYRQTTSTGGLAVNTKDIALMEDSECDTTFVQLRSDNSRIEFHAPFHKVLDAYEKAAKSDDAYGIIK